MHAPPDEGQALVEYALIIGLVTLFAVGSLQLLGTNVSNLLDGITSAVAGAV